MSILNYIDTTQTHVLNQPKWPHKPTSPYVLVDSIEEVEVCDSKVTFVDKDKIFRAGTSMLDS